MREIQQWVKSKPFGVASPEEYAKNKEFFSNWSVCLIHIGRCSYFGCDVFVPLKWGSD